MAPASPLQWLAPVILLPGNPVPEVPMPLFPRPDGTHIKPRELGAYRRLHGFMFDKRTQSTVFYGVEVDVTDTLAYIERQKASLPEGTAPGLFQILLCAMVRTLAQRPNLNRFVMGRRFYQRNSITLSFVVKKEKSETAKTTNAKMDFEPGETLASLGERLRGELAYQRDKSKTYNEKEMDSMGYLPRPLLSLLIPLFKFLDRAGLAPASMLRADPMYASAYVANLGSVGLPEAPYHTLFDWGTASLFVAIGSHKPKPVAAPDGSIQVRPMLPIHFSLDNRVLDGIYAARAIQLMEHYITHPEELERDPGLSAADLAALRLKPVKPIYKLQKGE